MSIATAIEQIRHELPSTVQLVAVSKFKPVEDIRLAYDAGQRAFGENRPQELALKAPLLPADIQWHFIGHLQTNKIKYIAPYVSLIHSIDSFDLLKEVNKHAVKNNRVIPCLLQFHIADEETKFGFTQEECMAMLDNPSFGELQNIQIHGVMGMATFTDDKDQVRREFHHLHQIFEDLKTHCFSQNPDFKELSMGMTEDYPIAIEEGSTLIRIGSAIFGPRYYQTED